MFNFYSLRQENRLVRIWHKVFITCLSVRNWPTAARDYCRLSSVPRIVLKFYSGQSLAVRANSVDAHEAVTILSGREYPYAVLKGALPLKGVVLDIGAHIGAFTVYLQGRRSDLQLYAVEPAADNFDLLTANLKLNDLVRVKAFAEAMTGGAAQAFLADTEGDSNAYHLAASGQAVAGIGLDDFLSREKISQINLLKMDCEGSEYEILSHSRRLSLISHIIMEYHKQSEERNDVYLINLLEAQGLTLRWRRDLSDHSRGLLYFARENK